MHKVKLGSKINAGASLYFPLTVHREQKQDAIQSRRATTVMGGEREDGARLVVGRPSCPRATQAAAKAAGWASAPGYKLSGKQKGFL